jgi:hypothetical protein
VPTPVPPSAAPTAPPTPYAEQIDPNQTPASIAQINLSDGLAVRPPSGGLSFQEIALLATTVLVLIAGTCFFLFFKLR